jgi:DNA-binding NtrC family response regulator
MSEERIISAFVVDDEHVIASTVATILKLSGFSASAFFSAEEALKAAKVGGAPKLLVTDVAMPGLSGIDLAIKFKELYPDCKALLFSGQAATGDMLQMAKEAGHSFTLLTKPVHPKDLLVAIRKLHKS